MNKKYIFYRFSFIAFAFAIVFIFASQHPYFHIFYITLSALCWNILMMQWVWLNKDRLLNFILFGEWNEEK